MKEINRALQLSASDLVGHLNCKHLTALDVQVASGTLAKPDHYDPLLEILRERGKRHEQAYLDYLSENGHAPIVIDGLDITNDSVRATEEAMAAGRADILRRVDKPSDLGPYSYEIIDTKLARETKGGTVLQLCLYADLLNVMQGIPPEDIYVVAPWSDFEPQRFRFADYAAYYRRVKTAAEAVSSGNHGSTTYPDPKTHCDICRWQKQCDAKRREDDHLCLVANITKNQIGELQANGYGTMQALAELQLPLPFMPQRGSPRSFEKARDQAAIQVAAREAGENKYILLDVIPEFGLAALPEPSPGDVFFDIESDQFVGEHGLEYLFGYAYIDENGKMQYVGEWALDRQNEKEIFERFLDFVIARREAFPALHIYHFGGYESGALKRLMGRYASREDEMDNLLRGQVLIDLVNIPRQSRGLYQVNRSKR